VGVVGIVVVQGSEDEGERVDVVVGCVLQESEGGEQGSSSRNKLFLIIGKFQAFCI
jgi:hypothetical protein